MRIVDCPGYGFARASQQEKEQWRKLMETYLQNSKSLHRILLLIDINTGVQASDNMLLDLLVEKSKPVSLVLTKSDKMKAKHVQKTTEAIIKEV